MNPKLAELRESIYDLMVVDEDTNDVKAVQNLGVSLANTKDRSIVVNQFQSVIIKKTINTAIKCLRIVDGLMEPTVTLLTPNVNSEKLQLNLLEDAAGRGIGLSDFKSLAGEVYAMWILENSKNKTEAADRLQINRTYLARVLPQKTL
jgi:hypothetical protein